MIFVYLIYTMHPDHYVTKSKKHKSTKELVMIQSKKQTPTDYGKSNQTSLYSRFRASISLFKKT